MQLLLNIGLIVVLLVYPHLFLGFMLIALVGNAIMNWNKNLLAVIIDITLAILDIYLMIRL